MSPYPPIAQAIKFLKKYYLARGHKLEDLRFLMTIGPTGKFMISRVDEQNALFDDVKETGITTIDDPASKKTGTYYFRPDNSGQFHQEMKLLDAFLQVQERAKREKIGEKELGITEDKNTFTIKAHKGTRTYFTMTFAKTPTMKTYLQTNPLPVTSAP